MNPANGNAASGMGKAFEVDQADQFGDRMQAFRSLHGDPHSVHSACFSVLSQSHMRQMSTMSPRHLNPHQNPLVQIVWVLRA